VSSRLDRLLWWLWVQPRPVHWDFKIPEPIWRWWTDRLAGTAFRPDIMEMLDQRNRKRGRK
jgi:hypothetical protein